MREPVERTIDGETYTFCQMTPTASLKLMVRIARIIGAPMGGIMGDAKVGKDILEQDIDVPGIVSSICANLDQDEVVEIVKAALSQTIHTGKGEVSKQFDLIFAGRLPHLFKVVGTALEVEYGDFFGGKPVFQGLLKKAGMTLA